MLFRLKPEDFQPPHGEAVPDPVASKRASLNDFSPEEWAVVRFVTEAARHGEKPAKGPGGLARYCGDLKPVVPPAPPPLTPLEKATARLRRTARRDGVAAVEFALVAPIFVGLLLAIVAYGGWFWLSHSVQSLAAESARAALGGLDEAEQRQLAQAFVAEQAARVVGLDPRLATVTMTQDAQALRVEVAYDAHDHPLILLAGPLPKPPATIIRSAVVRTGGY